jgi:DNA-binding PadR family transcriptional regulator
MKGSGNRGFFRRGGGRAADDLVTAGGGRFGGLRRGGGSRGGGRLFNQGDLRVVALQLIAEKPRHGYEIIKAIEDGTLGVYTPSAGAIYPTLTYLEELGYVSVAASPEGKKLYVITDDGRVFLNSSRELVTAIDARLAGLRKLQDGEPTQQIRRAMDNLKAGLRLRLSQGSINQEEIRRIVDAIDAAAVAVERA